MDNSNFDSRHGYLISPVQQEIDQLEELGPQERYHKRMMRKNHIVHAAIFGIVVCVIFALIKFIIGKNANSLAIESDAIDSLTESYSSIVAAIGITLAHKRPTKRFPNGFGRIEFITVIIGGIFVIVTGWHYFESSISRIQHPSIATVTITQLLIILATIIGKIILCVHDHKIGKEYKSAGLITASRSALLSVFSSALVVISALVGQYFKVDIDGWVGLIISITMLATGILGVISGMRPLLGTPVSKEVANQVTQILLKQEPIVGVYDLRLTNNGASIMRGTVNAEVPWDTDAEVIYDAFRTAETEIYRKLGIEITIGLLTVNYCSSEVYPAFDKISSEVLELDGVENLHGFKWNKETNEVDLHVIIDFKHLNDEKLEEDIENIVKEVCPGTSVLIDFNVNYLDEIPEKKILACSLNLDDSDQLEESASV